MNKILRYNVFRSIRSANLRKTIDVIDLKTVQMKEILQSTGLKPLDISLGRSRKIDQSYIYQSKWSRSSMKCVCIVCILWANLPDTIQWIQFRKLKSLFLAMGDTHRQRIYSSHKYSDRNRSEGLAARTHTAKFISIPQYIMLCLWKKSILIFILCKHRSAEV